MFKCNIKVINMSYCERGFSRYNLIKTYLRNRLKVSPVNMLLKDTHVCIHSSELKTFNFRTASELWCKAKDRRILHY